MQLLEVMSEVDLLPCMDGRGGSRGDIAIHVTVDERRVTCVEWHSSSRFPMKHDELPRHARDNTRETETNEIWSQFSVAPV